MSLHFPSCPSQKSEWLLISTPFTFYELSPFSLKLRIFGHQSNQSIHPITFPHGMTATDSHLFHLSPALTIYKPISPNSQREFFLSSYMSSDVKNVSLVPDCSRMKCKFLFDLLGLLLFSSADFSSLFLINAHLVFSILKYRMIFCISPNPFCSLLIPVIWTWCSVHLTPSFSSHDPPLSYLLLSIIS